MLCECKISIKCYDEEIEVAGQPAAHAKIKPEMDASIVVNNTGDVCKCVFKFYLASIRCKMI